MPPIKLQAGVAPLKLLAGSIAHHESFVGSYGDKYIVGAGVGALTSPILVTQPRPVRLL